MEVFLKYLRSLTYPFHLKMVTKKLIKSLVCVVGLSTGDLVAGALGSNQARVEGWSGMGHCQGRVLRGLGNMMGKLACKHEGPSQCRHYCSRQLAAKLLCYEKAAWLDLRATACQPAGISALQPQGTESCQSSKQVWRETLNPRWEHKSADTLGRGQVGQCPRQRTQPVPRAQGGKPVTCGSLRSHRICLNSTVWLPAGWGRDR